jgi:TrmH family RNA methyltransferase
VDWRNVEPVELAPALFSTLDLSGTRFPLLVIEPPAVRTWLSADGLAPGCTLLVPFQDPENVGAVIRSAAAFGVQQVVILAEGANPYHPKAIRASGGAVLAVTIYQGPSLNDLPEDLPVLALSAEGRDVTGVDFPNSFVLLPGLEGPGLPPIRRVEAVAVPMTGPVESLNAAVATAVVLYEWARRKHGREE